MEKTPVGGEGLELRDMNKEIHENLVSSGDPRRQGSFNTQIGRDIPTRVVLGEAPRPSRISTREPPVFPDIMESVNACVMFCHPGPGSSWAAKRVPPFCIHGVGTLSPRGTEGRRVAEATLGSRREDREVQSLANGRGEDAIRDRSAEGPGGGK